MKEKNENFSLEIKKSSKSHFSKVRAKVVLCRCIKRTGENLFGMRIEERNKIWWRTWAFKIDEEKAKHEGWSSEKITSSLNATSEYNGCPYCGGFSLAQCTCGKMFCYGNEISANQKQVELKCPWCNQFGVYQTAEAFDIQGGGF